MPPRLAFGAYRVVDVATLPSMAIYATGAGLLRFSLPSPLLGQLLHAATDAQEDSVRAISISSSRHLRRAFSMIASVMADAGLLLMRIR